MSKSVLYKHDLGDGLTLDAYSIDPSITLQGLREDVASKDGKPTPNLEKLVANTIFVDVVNSLDEFQIQISNGRYQVPPQLQAFRDDVQFQSDSIGRYNGPVLIVDKEVQHPLKCFRGGFYDYVATKLSAVPSELAHEFEILAMLPENSLFWRAFSDKFNKAGGQKRARELAGTLRGKYEQGASVDELFKQWSIDPSQRARYFGHAYMLRTANGNEISFVQRAKGMAIAADCISNPGSTPNPPFDEAGFDIKDYLRRHITTEMGEEYKMSASEFSIERLFLFDDLKEVPFANVEVVTPLSTSELAERIYGTPEAIKEHPVIYSMRPEAIDRLTARFPTWVPFVQTLRVFQQHE